MKKILIILLVVFATNLSFAQNDLGKLDDIGKISLTPVLSEALADMPLVARKMLLNKLQKIATRNGIGGIALDPNFIITATVDVETKDITPTAPPMIALRLNINFYIIDYANKTTLAEMTKSVKGVGKTEAKAYIQGIKNINVKSSSFKKFITRGKEKIVEYYNTNCDILMKKAEAVANIGKYEEAIITLMSVPEVCMECYVKAMDAVVPIQKKMISENCKDYLDAAKQAWLDTDLETARRNLMLIEPGTQCYDSGIELMKRINTELSSNADISGEEIKMSSSGESVSKEAVIVNAKEAAMSGATKKPKYNVDFVK